LLLLFQHYTPKKRQSAYAKVWNTVKPTLSPYIRNFADNIELLRKSKEDVRIDMALQQSTTTFQDSDDYDPNNIDNMIPTNMDFDLDEPLISPPEEFTTETLITAYYSIARSWYRENQLIGKRIPILLSRKGPVQRLQLENLLPLDIFRLPTYSTSGLRFFPDTTLQLWQSWIKGFTKLNKIDTMKAGEELAFDVDDFNYNLADNALHPSLTFEDSTPNLVGKRSRVGSNPTGISLTTIITEDIPLNKKQQLVVEKFFRRL